MGQKVRTSKPPKVGSRPGLRNRIRIIGGEHGGRKLSFPDGRGLRPTADRVRETLFNWLQAELPGASCLDLFAGSGALGLEAASRGAAKVTMLDNNPAVCKQLQLNIQLLKLEERVSIIRENAEHWLADKGTPYHVVFLDPPFADRLLEPCATRLQSQGWLAKGAKIYMERAVDSEPLKVPESWRLINSKRAGQVLYSLYEEGLAGEV